MSLRDHLDDETLRAALHAALARGGDFAEVYAERRRGRSLTLEDRRVEEVGSSFDVGAGVRVVVGGRTGYAYTNVLTRSSLEEAAATAASAARGAGDGGARIADLTVHEPPVRHPVREDPSSSSTAQVVAIARRADDAAREVSDEIAQVIVRYAGSSAEVLIARSDGRVLEDHRTLTRLVAQVVAARDDLIQTGVEAPGHHGGHELFDEHPPERVGATAARQAVTMLDSRPAPTGPMPVVLGPGDGGVLFHEAVGHGMEADLVARSASVFAGRRGERLGAESVTGVDDATVVNGWGSYGFDDEGEPAQRTVLFEAGVARDFLSDRRHARGLEQDSTGNGRRQSFRHLPVPRMSNTFILPGDARPADALDGLRRGLLCRGMGGGQVNTATGDFVFGVTEAYLIEDGEIAYPVRGANLVGNAFDVLTGVEVVADDLEFRQGNCGKDGQMVPAGIGSPTLRLGRLTIGGSA